MLQIIEVPMRMKIQSLQSTVEEEEEGVVGFEIFTGFEPFYLPIYCNHCKCYSISAES